MSPRRIARALAVVGGVALVAIVALTVWVVTHRSSGQAMDAAAGLLPGQLLHARNFHWTQMKAGKPQWVLKAAEATYSTDKKSVMLVDADLSMRTGQGQEVVVSAPRAVLRMQGNHITRTDLSGGTKIRYRDLELITDKITLMNDRDELEAPGLVTVTGQGLRVTGVGLSGNPKTRYFELHKQVRTRIAPREKRANAVQS